MGQAKKTVIIYTEAGEKEAFTTLTRLAQAKGIPYHKLKTESFPIDLGDVMIEKLRIQ